MNRIAEILLGLGLFVLWTFEVQVPDYSVAANGQRIYLSSVSWVSSLDLIFAALSLFAARKATKRPRRWRTFIGFGLTLTGVVALNSAVPQWMAIWNFAIAGAAFAIAAFAPQQKKQVSETQPDILLEGWEPLRKAV